MINLPREFYIPPKTEVIFVQDFFAKELVGGAELTSDAIIKACPKPLFQLHSQSLTETMLRKHRNKLWILANVSGVDPYLLGLLKVLQVSYFCLEYDYKWCSYRSRQLHRMKEGVDCNCMEKAHGAFHKEYFGDATYIFFMSQLQQEHCISDCGEDLRGKSSVLSSVWSKEDLSVFRSLRETLKNKVWAVLSGASWIKNQQATEKYCEYNGFPTNLLAVCLIQSS
jgi:hypothetical protein